MTGPLVERAAVGRRGQQHVGGPEVVVWGEGQRSSPPFLVEVGDVVVVGGAEVGLVGGCPGRRRGRKRKGKRGVF